MVLCYIPKIILQRTLEGYKSALYIIYGIGIILLADLWVSGKTTKGHQVWLRRSINRVCQSWQKQWFWWFWTLLAALAITLRFRWVRGYYCMWGCIFIVPTRIKLQVWYILLAWEVMSANVIFGDFGYWRLEVKNRVFGFAELRTVKGPKRHPDLGGP